MHGLPSWPHRGHVVKPAAGLCADGRGGTTVGSPQTICFLYPPGTGAPVAAAGGQRPVLRWCPVRLAPPSDEEKQPPRTRPASCRAMLARRWGYRRRDRVPPCDGPSSYPLVPPSWTRDKTRHRLSCFLQPPARACDGSRRTPFVPRDQREEGGACWQPDGSPTTPSVRPSSSGCRPTAHLLATILPAEPGARAWRPSLVTGIGTTRGARGAVNCGHDVSAITSLPHPEPIRTHVSQLPNDGRSAYSNIANPSRSSPAHTEEAPPPTPGGSRRFSMLQGEQATPGPPLIPSGGRELSYHMDPSLPNLSRRRVPYITHARPHHRAWTHSSRGWAPPPPQRQLAFRIVRAMGNLHETQELSLAGMSCRKVGWAFPSGAEGGGMGSPAFGALPLFPVVCFLSLCEPQKGESETCSWMCR